MYSVLLLAHGLTCSVFKAYYKTKSCPSLPVLSKPGLFKQAAPGSFCPLGSPSSHPSLSTMPFPPTTYPLFSQITGGCRISSLLLNLELTIAIKDTCPLLKTLLTLHANTIPREAFPHVFRLAAPPEVTWCFVFVPVLSVHLSPILPQTVVLPQV